MRLNGLMMCWLVAAGCSGRPSAIRVPRVDPDRAAAAAMDLYDADGDRALDEQELRACPPLCEALSRYDRNGDRRLETDEISGGIEVWAKGQMGATSFPFQVTLDGEPLPGAVVQLVPEKFLGEAVQPASGKSAQGGRGALGMAIDDLPPNAPRIPLVHPGLYRVEITHPSREIPEQYNTSTLLGVEVSQEELRPEGVTWNLQTR